MPSQDDWFLGDHYIEAEIDYLSEEVPEMWRLRSDFGRAKGMPELTPDDEELEMNKEIELHEGFDIDFKKYDCLFNYRPVDLDRIDYVEKPPTTVRNVLIRLSKKRLKAYNKEEGTSFKFVKIVKANYFRCVGMMYFITFEVIDPFDNLLKFFQAKINYCYSLKTDYYLCRPKPGQKVACIGTVRAHTSPSPLLLKAKAEYTTKKDEDGLHTKEPSDGQIQRNFVTAATVPVLNRFHVLSDITNAPR